jgi:hypothetical protein
MYGTYLHLDVHVRAPWRDVVRAAANKLASRARGDPSKRDRRKAFYRDMLVHHRQVQEVVKAWRL